MYPLSLHANQPVNAALGVHSQYKIATSHYLIYDCTFNLIGQQYTKTHFVVVQNIQTYKTSMVRYNNRVQFS